MGEKGTEISLGKDGFSFKTDGEASQRLANAALDFLSPITEGAGLLGTKLRGYRMEAALKATLSAKAICREHNLPINPVPPKFLLQWVEGASMEDIDDPENLTDLWANLLASSAVCQSPHDLSLISALKKMIAKDAAVFKELMANVDADDTNVIIAVRAATLGVLLGNLNGGNRISNEKPILSATHINEGTEYHEKYGVRFLIINYDQNSPLRKDKDLFVIDNYKNIIGNLTNLKCLGLIDIGSIHGTSNPYSVSETPYYIQWIELTPMGLDLLNRVIKS